MSQLFHALRLVSWLAISTTVPAVLAQSSAAIQYNPPNRGAPSETRNAASRTGSCGDLTAVQPTQTNWGETLKSHPTFGIYVAAPATNLTFELKDERSKETLHRVIFDYVEGPGISLYTLPDTAPALEPNQLYRWQVSLDCTQFNTVHVQHTDTKTSDGVIFRRFASDELQTTLGTVTSDEQVSLLAANGLWYDTVHTLLIERLNQPGTETWVTQWQSLVSHPTVQLDNLMNAVPLDCCLADNSL
ncbi:MAG: DUF928 domain-containing protein [Cyanobacteria bacterium P01_F01_bin.116]